MIAIPDLSKHNALARDFIESVAEATFLEYSEWFKPDGCILATRVFVGVMREFHIPAVDGISVLEFILNPAAAAHCKEHGCVPPECPEIMAGLVPDALVAAMGGHPERGISDFTKWGGHLIAHVGDTWAVDLTISQVARPDAGLNLTGTLTYPIDQHWMAGETWAVLGGVAGSTEAGITLFAHRHVPENEEWRAAADWQTRVVVPALVAGTVARLRGLPKPAYPIGMRLTLAAVGRV